MSLDAYLKSKNCVIIEGYSQQIELQTQQLIDITKNAKTCMEIGFNAGHSADLILANNPNVHLTSFDIGQHVSVCQGKEYIDKAYPGRHTLVLGDSTHTIPEYSKINPGKVFDVIFIDGGHTYPIPLYDLENCSKLADKDTVVAVDDVMFTKANETHWTIGPTCAWFEFLTKTRVIQLWGSEYDRGRGMVCGRYVQPNLQTERGWYNALLYHWQDALREKNKHGITPNDRPPAAIFADKYINDIKALRTDKVYDFCFIGSINSSLENRRWVIQFAKDHFTENSIFVNTDTGPWESLGSFDKTNTVAGFNPKEQGNTQSRQTQYRAVSENEFYFKTMCESKFILCPAGDGPWSFRFYESLLCGSIPIVTSWHHTYRTVVESTFAYKHRMDTDPVFVFDQKDVDFNDGIVSAFHSLKD